MPNDAALPPSGRWGCIASRPAELHRYVRIRSWHIVKFVGRAGTVYTRCGRAAGIGSPETDDIPTTEPSCETCLRLAANDQS